MKANVGRHDSAVYIADMNGRNKRFGLFLGAFALVNLFVFSVGYPQWHNYERLAHAGLRTVGRVTAREPANHNSVVYEYSVASNSFSGRSSASFGGLPPLNQIGIGDKIPVT